MTETPASVDLTGEALPVCAPRLSPAGAFRGEGIGIEWKACALVSCPTWLGVQPLSTFTCGFIGTSGPGSVLTQVAACFTSLLGEGGCTGA